MHHRRAQSPRATARRRNAKGRNDQRVCIFVPVLCCNKFLGGVLKPQTIFGPQLFKLMNYLSQLLGSLGTNRQFDLQGAKKISTFQSRIFFTKGI
jgi:hypothetical protein